MLMEKELEASINFKSSPSYILMLYLLFVYDMFSAKCLHLGVWFLCLCGEYDAPNQTLWVKFNV